MRHAGLANSRRAHHGDCLPGRPPGLLCNAIQQCSLFRASDKGRQPLGGTSPPTRQVADLDQLVAGNRRREPFHPPRRQAVERHKPGRKALTGFRHQNLPGLSSTLEALDEMNRRSARLIDGGKVGFDGVGDDVTRMQPNPHEQCRVVQQLDTANQLNSSVAGHHRMVVVGVWGTEQRDQPVATFLADDSAVAANRRSHGYKRGFEPRNRLFRIEIRDQIG
ncbi:hypothetical protein ES707_00002 [subsurface metagenome]